MTSAFDFPEEVPLLLNLARSVAALRQVTTVTFITIIVIGIVIAIAAIIIATATTAVFIVIVAGRVTFTLGRSGWMGCDDERISSMMKMDGNGAC